MTSRKEKKQAKKAASDFESLETIIGDANHASSANLASFSLIAKWREITANKHPAEIRKLLILALASVVIDDSILQGSTAPSDPEKVTIFLEIQDWESSLANSFRERGFLTELKTIVAPLMDAGVQPVRAVRKLNQKLDNVTLDPSRLQSLRQNDPQFYESFTNALGLLATTPYKVKPRPTGMQGDPGSTSQPTPKDLAANEDLSSAADSLMHKVKEANSAQSSTPPQSLAQTEGTPAAQTVIPATLPPQLTTPPVSALAPHTVGAPSVGTQSAGLQAPPPGPVTPSAQSPQPQRYCTAPLAHLTYAPPKAVPLAVAVPLADPTNPRTVYLPRYFTEGSSKGKIPASHLEYTGAAFKIMKLLQSENPAFNIADYIEYLSYINGLSEAHTWLSIMDFDEEFRAGVEMGLYNWRTTGCPLERFKLHPRLPDSYSYKTETGATVRKARTKSENPCNKWNADGNCPHTRRHDGCKYKHVCAKCNSPDHHMAQGHPGEPLIVFGPSPNASGGAHLVAK